MRAEHAPSNPDLYKNLAFGVQGTGGSTAIANSYEQMRKAGATARAMLVEAAAQAWRVPAGEITVERGVLRHASSGRRGRFGAVRAGRGATAGAGERAAQGSGALPADRPRRRGQRSSTAPSKTNGTAQFTIDIREPDMLTVVVARPPRFGGKVVVVRCRRRAGGARAWSTSSRSRSGVAVYAEGMWPALKGRERCA